MRKKTLGKRIQAFVLTLIMVASTFLAYAPEVEAEVGDRVSKSGSTGLSGDIDTSDTISLPIKIYDYENDGMLFEYSQAKPGADSDGDQVSTTEVSEMYTGGEDEPSGVYVYDFTKSKTYSTSAVSALKSASMGATMKSAVNNSSPAYMNVTCSDSSYDTSIITDFANDFDGSVNKSSVRYVVVVYKTNGISTSGRTMGFWVESNDSPYAAGKGSTSYTYMQSFTGSSSWTYCIYDLTKIATEDRDYNSLSTIKRVGIYFPGFTSSSESMDISHIGYFSTQSLATSFGKQAVAFDKNPGTYSKKTWNQGNNTAFSFLYGSREGTYDDNTYDTTSIANSGAEGIVHINAWGLGSEIDLSQSKYSNVLGYTLYTTLLDNGQGLMTMGLVEPELEEVKNSAGEVIEKRLVYREETVEYLAKLLSYTLPIPEKSGENYNYNYVMGAEHSRYGTGKDLAESLREKITNGSGSASEKLGSYNATLSKKDKLIGTWSECNGNITTYYDAAYFLLNNIFTAGSYNELQDDYEYLVLSKATTTAGKETYIFDGGFTDSTDPATAQSAVKYDEVNNTISNSTATDKTLYEYETNKTTTLYPFLPVTDDNNSDGQTNTPYLLEDGATSTSDWGATYKNRDYNYVLQSSGEFVYYADDELFFEFEGDDDVYLFINNQLVMDIGATHSITGQKMELNDYVEAAQKAVAAGTATDREKALNLEDGETYSFDFYYMERHGYGANIRINTNIRVTDPAMETNKMAYQNDSQLNYGDSIDKNNVVEYGFSITNSGNNKLYNLSFVDNTIGVTIDSENGLTIKDGYANTRVFDKNKGELTASDLQAVVKGTDEDGNYIEKTVSFENNDDLIKFMKDLTSDDVADSGGGLWQGSTLEIRGFAYLLTDEQGEAGVFDNIVYSSAWDHKTAGQGEHLTGQAVMRVYVIAEPMYYQWAGHEILVSLENLTTNINNADSLSGKVNGLTTTNVTSITECTSKGYATDYSEVTINGDKSLTINYATTGSHVFYLKVNYATNSSVIVPVLVNTTDVKDSVYVLDYGLSVELTENGEFFKNDIVNVPARTTKYGVLAIGENTPGYNPNDITFEQYSSTDTDKLGAYGDYELESGVLKYTPGGTTAKFMEGLDTIWSAVYVQDSEYDTEPVLGKVDINNEVQMYKQVTTLPANVVYYEDDFPAIQYYTNSKNTFESTGSSQNLIQSAEQTQEYGRDDAYKTNSDKSGNSLTTITLNDNSKVAYFDFKGTGFELISRTNAADSASLSVKVKAITVNADGSVTEGNTVKNIPVVTEFDNKADGGAEQISQVPVIRVDDLTYGTYRVEIFGVPDYDFDNWDGEIESLPNYVIPTTLYVDGLRIFQPLGASNDNYNATENGAEFKEIRDLIVAGDAAVAKYDGDTMKVSGGTVTWTENRNGTSYDEKNETIDGETFTGNQVDSVNDYLMLGPNNEVYMDGVNSTSAIVFYVKETGSGTHNLQLALRGIDRGSFYGAGTTGVSSAILYGVKTDDSYSYSWMPLVTATSGTEQYYTIDYTQCPYDADKGAYQVAIMANSGMVSYSSLKLNGLEIVGMKGETATLSYQNGILVDSDGVGVATDDYPSFFSLRSQLMSRTVLSGNSVDSNTDNDTDNGNNDSNTNDNTDNKTDNNVDNNGGTAGDSTNDENVNSSNNSDVGNTSGNTANNGNISASEESQNDKAPTTTVDTGDHANTMLYVILLVAAVGVIVAVLVKRRESYK